MYPSFRAERPNLDDIEALIASSTFLVQENAKLDKVPELDSDSPLLEGILGLCRVNVLLGTSDMVKDPQDILMTEEYPKAPIVEETAVSIAATQALEPEEKLKLFDTWAEAASTGTRAQRLAPTKGLARICGIAVVTDRYNFSRKKHGLRATSYVDAFITAVDYNRPIIGRVLRKKDELIANRAAKRFAQDSINRS